MVNTMQKAGRFIHPPSIHGGYGYDGYHLLRGQISDPHPDAGRRQRGVRFDGVYGCHGDCLSSGFVVGYTVSSGDGRFNWPVGLRQPIKTSGQSCLTTLVNQTRNRSSAGCAPISKTVRSSKSRVNKWGRTIKTIFVQSLHLI